MLPRLTRVLQDACGTRFFSSDRGCCLIRFVLAPSDGSAVSHFQGHAPADCSLAIAALELPAVDEFVQLTDLLAHGDTTGVPMSRAAEALITEIATAAFWGVPAGASPPTCTTPLLDAVLLPDGAVAAGWFHHGHGASLTSLYMSSLTTLAGTRHAHLQLIAADQRQVASKAFSQDNAHRGVVWQPASRISARACYSVHSAQTHALLRALRRHAKAGSGGAEEAWMLLHLRRLVWWWGKTAAQQDEACEQLAQTVVRDGPPGVGDVVPRSRRGRVRGVDGTLALGLFHLVGTRSPEDAQSLLSAHTVACVRRHLKRLQDDERRVFFTDMRGDVEAPAMADTDAPSVLAETHLTQALWPHARGAPVAKRAVATAPLPRPEFTGFSVGVDAGRYWSSLLCAADFLCAHFSACGYDGGSVCADWQHALRAALLRRYGPASTSTWLSPDQTRRAFPFMNAVQRSYDAHPVSEDAPPRRRALFLTHASGALALPPDWMALVEALPPRVSPCFASADACTAASQELREGAQATASLPCHLLGAKADTCFEVQLSADHLSKLLAGLSGDCDRNWMCLLVNGTVCEAVCVADTTAMDLLFD